MSIYRKAGLKVKSVLTISFKFGGSGEINSNATISGRSLNGRNRGGSDNKKAIKVKHWVICEQFSNPLSL